ncbi:hypothetical protein AK812_SmicGene47168, partial [Symbiodinium microadriaticum]
QSAERRGGRSTTQGGRLSLAFRAAPGLRGGGGAGTECIHSSACGHRRHSTTAAGL